MRYMLFVCPRPDFAPTSELEAGVDAWVARYDASGQRITGDVLLGESRGAIVGDGPADATIHVAGFDIIECATLDEAVAIAEAHPMPTVGSIVVRPFMGG